MDTLKHYTPSYYLTPVHPITINVIGCGGTGSHVLSGLGRMNEALRALGHPGLFVTAFDSDHVTPSNLGRQLFSASDLNQNKATTMITRLNRFYGTNWRGIPLAFDKELVKKAASDKVLKPLFANITVTCVDSLSARKDIAVILEENSSKSGKAAIFEQLHYWLDYGNSAKVGQVVLGTLMPLHQPDNAKDGVSKLPTVFERFPNFINQKEDKEEPSCSMHEALRKQDLFVNSILAQYGVDLLWKMFRDLSISHHGMFLNLENFRSSPIPIQAFEVKAA